MGYENQDLEEVSTRNLCAELERRRSMIESGLCPYCETAIAIHTCKYKDRIKSTYGTVESITAALRLILK